MMEANIKERACRVSGQIAVICGSLGHIYKGEYLIEPDCLDGVKDLIRLLKKDDVTHINRRCMGEINIVQNHLIHIVKNCPSDSPDLFSISLRLLINLTTPAILLYGEDIPRDKTNRHIYMSLVGHDQSYKLAFTDVELWNKICCRMTNLFEKNWTERSDDDGIEIERILTLIRNVLQIPGDIEDQKKLEKDTVHDKILWALRESQILELLLLIASNKNEEAYYLNLLEIFSLLLREQDPKTLARCEGDNVEEEKNQDIIELLKAREEQKNCQKKYSYTRNFKSTFVMRGMKSSSNIDLICHRSLESIKSGNAHENKGQMRPKRTKAFLDEESSYLSSNSSVRFFLKEFCKEFMNSSFDHFMSVVKNRMDSGKSLAHDQTYYFWALTFFLKFAVEADMNVELIRNCLSVECFHFIQTNIELAFGHLKAEKKDAANWVKRIHTILKAYHSLLEMVFWMDRSKSPLVRSVSREMKSNIFFVVEYRELTLYLLLNYDPLKFPLSYLRDLIQTSHIFIKLLEEFSTQTKLIVQKVVRKTKTSKKKKSEGKKEEAAPIMKTAIWNRMKDDVYDCLSCETSFPEMVPFDAASDVPIDDQKERAMFNIQKLLHNGKYREAIGYLRCSRQVWPENDYFGTEGMAPEDETMALGEICLADLEHLEATKASEKKEVVTFANEMDKEEDEDGQDEYAADESYSKITEQEFRIADYKKRLANKKVVEICGILLRHYAKNSDYLNHCGVKLLHRIGWECAMPAMLFQASLFYTLFTVMNDRSERYQEIKTFAINLMRLFRKHASRNVMVFVELLFWKASNIALEIQHGYAGYGDSSKGKTSRAKNRKEGKKTLEKGKLSESSKRRKSDSRKKRKEILAEKNVDDEHIEGSSVKCFENSLLDDPERIRRRSESKDSENCQSDTDIESSSAESDFENYPMGFRRRQAKNIENRPDLESKTSEEENEEILNERNNGIEPKNGNGSRLEEKINSEEENKVHTWNEPSSTSERKKRARFISSDSDDSEDKAAEEGRNKRTRANIIDSDSDFDS